MLTLLNPELAIQLWPLIAALLSVVAFALIVFIQAPKRYKLKLVLIPIALLVAAYSYLFVGNLVGYSFPGNLPVKFVYIAHRVLITDQGQREGIEVWTQVGSSARLYRIPYTKPMERLLEQANKGKQAGGVPVLETNKKQKQVDTKGTNRGEEQQDEYPFKLNLLAPSDIVPKEQQ